LCYIVEKNVWVEELSYTRDMYTRAVLGIVVVAGIILAVFFFWPGAENEPKDIVEDTSAAIVDVKDDVVIEHLFDDGVHTISGVVTLPTPCHELQENIRIAESFPEQVSIDLAIVDTGGVCIQVIDDREFSIDVEVDEAASFTLSIDGVTIPVPTLVIE